MDHCADVDGVEIVVDKLEVVAACRWRHAADQLQHSGAVGLLHPVAHIIGNSAFQSQGRDCLGTQALELQHIGFQRGDLFALLNKKRGHGQRTQR